MRLVRVEQIRRAEGARQARRAMSGESTLAQATAHSSDRAALELVSSVCFSTSVEDGGQPNA
jgi:hypothetical protein